MAVASLELQHFTDLSQPIMFSDPHPRYAELRRDAPVSLVKSQQFRGQGYMLTRYDDVMLVHTDERFSSDQMQGRGAALAKFLPRMFRLLTDSMVFKDDPDHQRLRGLVNQVFTPRMVAGLQEDIERITAGLLDDLARKEHVDLVEDYTVRLPLAVIASMLGIEDADRDRFHSWTKSLLEGAGGGGVFQMILALPKGRRLIQLFERLADHRRVEPDDRVITGLVRASDEGDQLSEHEIIAMIFLLLLAGHDTTASLLANAIPALLENPVQLERLRDEPGLIDSAVEELVRYTAPVVHGVPRVPLEDVEIKGVAIPKGSHILGMLISANRDESVFPDADALDLGRDPNRHVGFGWGAHFCLGNQLARLEAKIGLQSLLERFGKIELSVPAGELRYKPSESLRGLRSLPLRLR